MTEEARKPKRRQAWKGIAAMVLILCVTLATAWHSRKRSLLEQSMRVVGAQDGWQQPYRWLSDHQFIIERWQKPVSPSQQPPGLYIYDIHTRKETFLRSLSQALEKANYGYNPNSLRISPDGTRLLWFEFSDAVYGACFDGSHFFTFPAPRDQDNSNWIQVRWASDSRHWVVVRNQHGAIQGLVYDGDPSHKPKVVPVTASDQSDLWDKIGIYDDDFYTPLILNDHFLMCKVGNQATRKVDVLDIRIGAHTTGLKTPSIQLPPDVGISEIAISPQGDRIAWNLTMPAAPKWVLALKRWVRHTHGEGEHVEGLWVSRIDGTEMREIGRREMKSDGGSEPRLYQLQWVPGSKRLSFMFDSALYTVPVE